MQLDIVVKPFINVSACVLKHNDSVFDFMSTQSVSARCPVRELAIRELAYPRLRVVQ